VIIIRFLHREPEEAIVSDDEFLSVHYRGDIKVVFGSLSPSKLCPANVPDRDLIAVWSSHGFEDIREPYRNADGPRQLFVRLL
jgi:hypothetical protein